MTRIDFVEFVQRMIEEVIRLAEEKSGKSLPRRYAFRWLGRSYPVISTEVAKYIAQRVFVDEDHIYPCVDIGVGDVLEDGTPLIVGTVAGYPPRSFGPNWTGRMGPFVHIVGQPFLNRMAGKPTRWQPDEGVFGYSIPETKNLI